MNGLRAIEKHGGVACPFLPAGKRGQILFFVWVDSSEQKWVILAERRGAKRNSKQRIDPLIEESTVLRELVRDPRSRDSCNTMLAKEFPGGMLGGTRSRQYLDSVPY